MAERLTWKSTAPEPTTAATALTAISMTRCFSEASAAHPLRESTGLPKSARDLRGSG